MMLVRPTTARLSQVLPRCRRTFITLPDLSAFAPGSSEPQRYKERKVLPYTQKQLYDVVSNVASYPKFVPFCSGSRILTHPPKQTSDGKQVVEAELTVGFLAFKESYVSTVTCIPNSSVEAVASSSTPLFETLSTIWRFEASRAATPNSTLVTLDLEYAFANPLHASVSSAFFGQVSKAMVQAFEERCRRVYG
ncbi:hypothetical protein D9611_007706 [Ephemerocybe angulata]|uniref:Coenzyme Q-binding protein COQ10 START domain-containing protein n=1 Tax=Ephemerocybe angulata TaxID=980116 RepID=A0A8H5BYP8_9AGAR|nr:hypothetical protein D9611_007706 [Tulosesus angulatus]